MAEVVQDLFDHVTYAGGLSRRRVDAVRGFAAGTPRPGEFDCALVKGDDGTGSGGPLLRGMRDLTFNEMLDKPFEEKSYRAQLQEFAYRGEHIIAQIDRTFGQVQELIDHDVLGRSRSLPGLVRCVSDELHRAHTLICGELEGVWHLSFEPFFYPADEGWEASSPSDAPAPLDFGLPPLPDASSMASLLGGGLGAAGAAAAEAKDGIMPGGWLDLRDMLLTALLLTRHVAELVAFVGAMVQDLPPEAFATPGELRGSPPSDALCALVSAFAIRVPWLGITVLSPKDCETSLQQASVDAEDSPGALNEALAALDDVLTVQIKRLSSALHRAMYEAFVRMAAAYSRWKRIYRSDQAMVRRQLSRSTGTRESMGKRGTASSRQSSSASIGQRSPSPRKSARFADGDPAAGAADAARASALAAANADHLSSRPPLAPPARGGSGGSARPGSVSFSKNLEAHVLRRLSEATEETSEGRGEPEEAPPPAAAAAEEVPISDAPPASLASFETPPPSADFEGVLAAAGSDAGGGGGGGGAGSGDGGVDGGREVAANEEAESFVNKMD